MKVYVTKNSEYPVFNAGGLDAIMANKGENKDKLYGIVGFWDKQTPVMITYGRDGVDFFSTKDGKSELIPYDDLSKFLDQTAGKGKRVVSRLLSERGNFVEVGTPWDIIITSSIQEIRE
ncbi:MAG TPA: hypothetical protein VMC80_01580 [Patescibacteria group bacterium]|nr:hypothetical protein [Patescibacteria group bacterium]